MIRNSIDFPTFPLVTNDVSWNENDDEEEEKFDFENDGNGDDEGDNSGSGNANDAASEDAWAAGMAAGFVIFLVSLSGVFETMLSSSKTAACIST